MSLNCLSQTGSGCGAANLLPTCCLIPLVFPLPNQRRAFSPKAFHFPRSLFPTVTYNLELTKSKHHLHCYQAALWLNSTATTPLRRSSHGKMMLLSLKTHFGSLFFVVVLVIYYYYCFFSRFDFWQEVKAQCTEPAAAKLPARPIGRVGGQMQSS